MVARYVRAHDVVLEGGAGIGSVSRVLLDVGASVTSYEPGEAPFAVLLHLADVYATYHPVKAALAPMDGRIPYHVYEPWYASRTTALGGLLPVRTIAVPAHDWRVLRDCQQFTGLLLNLEGMEHRMLPDWFRSKDAQLRWIVAELHGEPDVLARTLDRGDHPFVLDAIEANGPYLVAGWVRRDRDA